MSENFAVKFLSYTYVDDATKIITADKKEEIRHQVVHLIRKIKSSKRFLIDNSV